MRSRIAEAFGLAGPIQKTVRDYYDRWGVFPANNAEAGLHPAEHYVGSNVKSIRVERGVILITLSDKGFSSDTKNQNLHLIPTINSAAPTAPFAWVCEGTPPSEGLKPTVEIPEEQFTIPGKYLPSNCRRPPRS
ncbi:MAG: pilin [Burkholderiales bacterium]|nr:pilin [Burkholderiales bacterium]